MLYEAFIYMRFPTIPYPGGKGRLAPLLIDMMPRSGDLYLEPFAGRGNVFWTAASFGLSFHRWQLNDLRTAPFFEAIRLVGDSYIVPERSKEEYYRQWELFKQNDPSGIIMEPQLTFGGGGYGSGGPGGKKGATAQGYTKTLRVCHALMQSTNVTITNLDWRSLPWESLSPDAFVYLDPPYREADVRAYNPGDVNHEELVRVLLTAKFRWMLSEYSNDLYTTHLGQPQYTKDMQLIAADHNLANGGKERRIECIWKNY